MSRTRDDVRVVVWDVLWESLAGGNYDVEALKAQASEDSDLVKDLNIDSLDLVDFYLRVQDRFGVEIDADDYSSLTSVAALSTALRARTGTTAS